MDDKPSTGKILDFNLAKRQDEVVAELLASALQGPGPEAGEPTFSSSVVSNDEILKCLKSLIHVRRYCRDHGLPNADEVADMVNSGDYQEPEMPAATKHQIESVWHQLSDDEQDLLAAWREKHVIGGPEIGEPSTGKIIDFNRAKPQCDGLRREVDFDDVKARLNAKAREFVGWMYSGRAVIKHGGAEARIGNAEGEAGSSLAIELIGPKAGLWNDHATDEGGDLISLYMAYMNYADTKDNFVFAVKEIARDFLHDRIDFERPLWTPTPETVIRTKKEKFGDKPRDEDLEQLGAPVATYHYLDVSGNIVADVKRYDLDAVDETGKRKKTFVPHCFRDIDGKMTWVAGAPESNRPLYRLPQISRTQIVVLVEGEKCADALASVNIEATSAMSGAKAPKEKTDWSPLAGKTVIVWPDNDQPSWDYANEISAYLLSLGCNVLGVSAPAGAPPKWDAADCVESQGDPRVLINAALPWTGAVIVSRKATAPGIVAAPYIWKDPETIAPRQWLYGHRLIRKFATVTIAPGGVGKSSLEIAEALAMVSGKALLGVRTAELLRVWLWNLEDPREETERRIQATAKYYNLKPDDLDGLFLNCADEQPLVIAETNRNGFFICRPVIDALVAQINQNKIDVVIIDPFVSSHHVPENDNNAIDAVVKEWARVAKIANCSIELVHHVRKGEQEITVESARGGGSFGDAARMARVINRMTKEEAANAGITDNRLLYFRAFIDKRNLAPPADASDWFKLVGVDLHNGPLGPAMPGDSVGVVISWEYPKALDGMTSADFAKVAAVIRSDHWRKDSQAASWVGYAIAKALGLDVTNPVDKAKVKRLLKAWLGTGSLVVVPRLDPGQRRPKDFVEVADDE
ncbi:MULTISPECIES: AAA family ATPase [unclassified Bradyrhizobium]